MMPVCTGPTVVKYTVLPKESMTAETLDIPTQTENPSLQTILVPLLSPLHTAPSFCNLANGFSWFSGYILGFYVSLRMASY